jgi:hypothetical protein
VRDAESVWHTDVTKQLRSRLFKQQLDKIPRSRLTIIFALGVVFAVLRLAAWALGKTLKGRVQGLHRRIPFTVFVLRGARGNLKTLFF